jgi:hypothetical protein
MTRRSDGPHQLGDEGHDVPDRLAELLAGWVDDDLSETESAELKRWRCEDPRAEAIMEAIEKTDRRLRAIRQAPLAGPRAAQGLSEAADQRIWAALSAEIDQSSDASPEGPVPATETDQSPDSPRESPVSATKTDGLDHPVPLAEVGRRRTASPRSRVGVWTTVAVVAAVATLLAAAALLVVHQVDTGPTAGVVPTADAPRVDKQELLFNDGFPSGGLDPRRWNPPSRPDLISSAEGGGLLLQFDRDVAGTAEMTPKFDRPFREIVVQAVVLDDRRLSDGGGAWLNVITQRSDLVRQTYQLGLGPDGSKQPVGAGSCEGAACAAAVERIRPPLGVIDVGAPFTLRAIDVGGQLRFSIDGRPVVYGPRDNEMVGFTLSVTGIAEDSWDVRVNNLTVLG